MRVTHGTNRLAAETPRAAAPVLAIGNFDGVHIGHQHIFHTAIDHARARGTEAWVLTFDPHPAKILAPDRAPPLLMTRERKLSAIADTGIDRAIVETFDVPFSRIEADEFVRDLILTRIGPSEVCVGYDYRFGHGRRGDGALLRLLAAPAGVLVTVFEPVKATIEGIETVVSSTRVRALLAEGDVATARHLLDRPFAIDGTVVPGQGRGRGIGVPTINVAPETEARPRLGVYAGFADLPGGARHRAAINVGRAPTFSAAGDVTIEAHLLDFTGDLYGARVSLGFCTHLRDERRFDSVEALVAEIHRDIQRTRDVLANDAAFVGAGLRAPGTRKGAGA